MNNPPNVDVFPLKLLDHDINEWKRAKQGYEKVSSSKSSPMARRERDESRRNNSVSMYTAYTQAHWHNPGNVPPPSIPEDSIFCKTNKAYGMKVNITI